MNADALKHRRTFFNELIARLPPTTRGHVVAFIGEFAGTFFFLFFAFSGAQTAAVASNPNEGSTVITATPQKTASQLLYPSLAFGFSLAVNAWVYFRISRGLFNPAVCTPWCTAYRLSGLPAYNLTITHVGNVRDGSDRRDQYCSRHTPFRRPAPRCDRGCIRRPGFVHGKLNVSTTLSDTTTIAQGVIIEMLLTTQLVFTIFMLAAEKHAGNFIAPVGIRLSLFIAELTSRCRAGHCSYSRAIPRRRGLIIYLQVFSGPEVL
jgi:aquaporin related protein